LLVTNLNNGLKTRTPHGSDCRLLVKANGNGGQPIIRAATSETYGRVWDGPLYSGVRDYFGDGARSSNGGIWQSAPTWDGETIGGYRGDRDSFVLRIDGGSIVNDPRGFGAIGQNGGHLNRGIMVKNSEVGASGLYLDCVLFDKICGNHILWGAVIDRKFRRRHVGTKVLRDTLRELLTIAREYSQRSAAQDDQIIRTLVSKEIASTRQGVIDELRALKYTKEQAEAAYDLCEAKEPTMNPRSYWGAMSGTTRLSQESGHQDERYTLDALASTLLAKGARLVTV
jgi:hypothetical protein